MENILKTKPWFIEILKKPELQDITLRNLYEFYLTGDNILKILPIITSNSNISIRVLDWFVTNYSKKYTIIYDLKGIDINGDRYFNVFLQYKCQLKSYKKKLFDPFCRKQRIAFHYDENKCVVTTIGQLNFFRWAINYGVLKYVEEHLQKITSDMINSNKTIVKKYKTNNGVELTSSSSVSSDGSNLNKTITQNDQGQISNVAKSKTTKHVSTNDTKDKSNKQTSSNSTSMGEIVNSTDSEKTRKKRQELSTSANKTINIHNYSIVLTFD